MRKLYLCFILYLLALPFWAEPAFAEACPEYTILNPASGLFLTAASPGGGVNVSELHDNFTGQIFCLEGQRILLSGSSPMQALTYSDGTLMLCNINDDNTSQQWEFENTDRGCLILHEGQALTILETQVLLAPNTGIESQLWRLLPHDHGEAPPEPTVTISWEDHYCYSFKQSAYTCIKPVASQAGVFSDFHLKVWDQEGNLVAFMDEDGDSTMRLSMNIWYEIFSETGVLLSPETPYSYQFSVTFNGKTFSSPIYSFVTGNADSRRFGIDVSSHNGTIDWQTASAHIDYAILRCGYGSDYQQYDDSCWQYNVSECERLSIPYGVYLYSYAENDEEALSEADHVLRLLNGHTPTLPIYYDLEDAGTVGGLSNPQIMQQTKLFCDRISKAGFRAGIYANVNWWNNRLDGAALAEQSQWLAAWSGAYANLAENYAIWQFSNYGRVPGISTRVDLDYCHNFSFSEIEEPQYTPLDPDIILPNNLKVIESEAFAGCSFSAVRISDITTIIGPRAFANCSALRQIEIPPSVEKIADDAFDGCEDLVIMGVAGSEAEIFCAQHDYIWVIP